MANTREDLLVISCEHGGRDVPRDHAAAFAGQQALLDSHRGWDPGALELASQMALALAAVVHASTTTRLLVDLNRSLGHPGLFSPITRALPALQRRQIVERHYRPHRDAFEAEVARAIAGGRRVVHIASHSFTPTLDGVPRHADVAWLYDPGRAAELAFACAWKADLAQRAPGLVLRRNYPYRGRSDGLTACLRKRHADADYLGIELEVNQRFVARGGAAWDELRAQLVASLAQTLEAAAGSASTAPGAAGR